MRTLAVVGLFCIALLQTEAHPIESEFVELPKYLRQIKSIGATCGEELALKAKSLPKIHGLQQLPQDNESLTSLLGCTWMKLGILNEAAELDQDKLQEYLTNAGTMFIPTVVNRCKDVTGEDPGKRAVNIQNCINDYMWKLMQKYVL